MSGTTGAVPISGQRLHWGAALTEEKSSQVSGTFTNCVPPSGETITWRAVAPPFGRIVAAAECRIPGTVSTVCEVFSLGGGRNFSPARTARYGVFGATVRGWRRMCRAATCRRPMSRCACVCAAWFPHSWLPWRWTPVAACGRYGNEPVPTAAELVRQAGRLAAALPDAGWSPARRTLPRRRSCAPSNGGHAAWPVSTCRSGGEVRGVSDFAPYPASPTSTGRRTASSPRCWAAAGRWRAAGRTPPPRRRPARPAGRRRPRACRRRCGARMARALRAPAGRGRRSTASSTTRPWRRPAHLHRPVAGSVVQVNAGARTTAGRLPRLVAHETYPGHHVECLRAERAAAARTGRAHRGRSRHAADRGVRGTRRVRARRGGRARVGAVGRRGARHGRRAHRRWRWPSGWTPSWRCCSGPDSTPRCCCTATAGRPRAGRRRGGAPAALAAARGRDRARRVVDGPRRPLWRTQVVASDRGGCVDAGVAAAARRRTPSRSTSASSTIRPRCGASRPNEYGEFSSSATGGSRPTTSGGPKC